jgi:hypothetical protein
MYHSNQCYKLELEILYCIKVESLKNVAKILLKKAKTSLMETPRSNLENSIALYNKINMNHTNVQMTGLWLKLVAIPQ